MRGLDVSLLMVQWKDANHKWHEEILNDSGTTYDGISLSGLNDRHGWIDYGGGAFSFDPDWPTMTVRGRLSEDAGREYFEECILMENE